MTTSEICPSFNKKRLLPPGAVDIFIIKDGNPNEGWVWASET